MKLFSEFPTAIIGSWSSSRELTLGVGDKECSGGLITFSEEGTGGFGAMGCSDLRLEISLESTEPDPEVTNETGMNSPENWLVWGIN